MSGIFIIAEAGVNHNGDLQTAQRLVDEAARAGADAVKFQTFQTEKLVRRTLRKRPIRSRPPGGRSLSLPC